MPVADELFGAEGIFPYDAYVELMNYYGIEFMVYPFSLNFFPIIFLLSLTFMALMYMFGIGGKLTGFLMYFMIIILKIRNGFILDGSDNVIQVTLPFLILADNLDHFRLFERKKSYNSLWKQYLSKYFHVGLLIQVSYVYFFTALAKFQGELWLNGTATYYTMRVRDFMATDFNLILTKNHYFVVISTYFTLFWEISFPFLIWFKKSKIYIVIFGIILHVGIWIFMRIDNFSWVMISTYLLFFNNDEIDSFFIRIKKCLPSSNIFNKFVIHS